jgi:hypothetical protein
MSDVNPIENHPDGKSTLGLQLYLIKMMVIEPFDDPMKGLCQIKIHFDDVAAFS